MPMHGITKKEMAEEVNYLGYSLEPFSPNKIGVQGIACLNHDPKFGFSICRPKNHSSK